MRLIPWPLLPLALLAGSPALTTGEAPGRPVTSDQLGGADRYLAHVTTDKPIYRSGETLFARGVVLHAGTRAPLAQVPWTNIQVIGPKGDVVAQEMGSGSDGVVAWTWTIPEDQAGGTYKVKMSASNVVTGERGFEVRAFRAPRINSQIVFLRDGYAPGDEVTATLQATRAEGGAPVGAKVTLDAMVDGAEAAHADAGTIDAAGRLTAHFRLPQQIERGEGTLALVIEDGGVVETATKTIPILLHVVDLAAYPEGGDLVAGLPTRVYVEARTPAGKPADIAGQVETVSGTPVAKFRTEHEGRGRVSFTPTAGQAYRLRITEPGGIRKLTDLPSVRENGGVIGAVDDVTAPGGALRLRVGATGAGRFTVTVSARERAVAKQAVALEAGVLRPVALTLPASADGVLRVTLWADDGAPLAERLVFRKPAHELKVWVAADRDRYVPGGTVALKVHATTEDGKPASAMVGLSVSDESVRGLLEKRDLPPQLPVQVLLEDDVKELADANVYLDPADKKAPRALDLLLGTQGWRRFAFLGDPTSFAQASGDAARRVLAFPERVAMPMALDDVGVAGGVARRVDFLASEHLLKREERGQLRPLAAVAPAPPEEQVKDKEALKLQNAVNQPVAAPEPFGDKKAAGGRFVAGAAARRDMDEMDFRARTGSEFVREYAHAARAGRQPGERVDFTDTVYWNAGVKTDAHGLALVTFALSDAVTSFRVLADAFSPDGALGGATKLVESVQPFYLEPKFPLEVTYGDHVRLPVTAINGTLDSFGSVDLRASGGPAFTFGKVPHLSLGPDARERALIDLAIGQVAGPADLTLTGDASGYHDSVTRTMQVAPLGFPASESFGGLLPAGGHVSHALTIPRDLVAGSVRASIKVYPSALGQLNGALERLIQEPYGCFEQTSSTTYPLVMAQQYFTTHQGVDPALITKSQDLLGKGYDRLTGFETKTRGYEWFGESPGHEALSAFGLLEFTDMSRVRAVDPAMLARTREWVLATRDGKGGFKRERRALHTWIEDVDCSNAYILWALLATGEPASSLGPEIESLSKAAKATSNSYVKALAANVMQLAGRQAEAEGLLDTLASRQGTDGRLAGATASIVGSTGETLDIEATSFATLAWLQSPPHQAQVEKAIHWLADVCQGGRFGSTQSTVLALRAIVAYDAARARPRAPGSVTLTIDGQPVGAPLAFDDKTDSALVFAGAESRLPAGRHEIGLAVSQGSEMPYAIEIGFNRETPETSKDCPLDLQVSLTGSRFAEGELAQATATLTSHSDEPLPMAVAIIGLPGGMEPRHEQLKELVKSHAVAAYEVTGRNVVLYFRSLEPRAEKRIPLSLVAAVPGTYTGPASRAYLYYTDDQKTWAPGFKVEIVER